jgi:hypothetical protein
MNDPGSNMCFSLVLELDRYSWTWAVAIAAMCEVWASTTSGEVVFLASDSEVLAGWQCEIFDSSTVGLVL